MKSKHSIFLIPLLFIRNPFKMGEILKSPNIINILGTDNLGRDIYTRLILGTVNTLVIILISITLASIIGNIIGIISGYYGGIIDNITQFFVDLVLSIPSILIVIFIVVIMGSGYLSLVISISTIYMPLIIKYSRGLVVIEKNKDYITAT